LIIFLCHVELKTCHKMKNIFRLALIKSATIIHDETGKLLCQILSATKSKSPRPSVVSSDEYFTTNHQLALYLHRSDSCTKKYRYLGFIPFIKDGGRILVKKSDVENVVKLYPNLVVSSPIPSRPAPRIFTQLIEADDETTFIRFTYQGEKIWIPVSPEKSKDRKTVHSLCHKVIQLLHQIKPFKITPDNSKIAA
jgi:hypothetical protein